MDNLTEDEWNALVDELIEHDVIDDEASARRDYVGRGMRGDSTCIGIVVESTTGLIGIGAALVKISDEPFAIAGDAWLDSMGKRTIVYWPSWQVEMDDERPGPCLRCGLPVTFLRNLWWTADDDFNCPDGEWRHARKDRELSFDEAERIGRDGTGRDGDPRFPHRFSSLTQEERIWLMMPDVPADYEVKALTTEERAKAEDVVTCGTCGRSWDDAISTSMTPAPSARCPFEYYH